MKRILCPIDFSEFSRHALDSAVALASTEKAHVIALHVFVQWPAVDVIPSLQARAMPETSQKGERDALRRSLEAFVAARPHSGVAVETKLEDAADVVREILAQAEALHVDLIVMGSHGRSGFERVLLGSITEKVLRKAYCPVMVVPRGTGKAVTATPFTRILCPMDFSTGAMAALGRATALARNSGAEITVLHVIEIPAALYEMPGFDIAEYRAGAEKKSRMRLAELVPENPAHPRNVIVSEGRTADEILRVAAERDVDVIVMGVQGRHAVDVMVFGSATHEVIRRASCPVLTVRGEGRVR